MDDTQTTARPVAITVICILGFIGAALAIPLIFSAAAREIGAWYPRCIPRYGNRVADGH